jgi:hypothetical protein
VSLRAGPRAFGIPDWTDAASYAPLLRVERAGFAWEWLRRYADYESAARHVLDRGDGDARFEDGRALAWNLHAFEDPDLAAPEARPVWTATAHAWVLPATAGRSAANEDSLDLAQFDSLARLVVSPRGERLLLSDGYRSIRLDVRGDSLRDSPVSLSYELAGIQALERPLIVLRRLRALVAAGRFVTSLHPPPQRASRLIQLLRAYDGIRAGARHIDIADVLLRSGLEHGRWRVHSPSVRSQAQRLARAAKHMANSQFWALLD